MVFKEKENTNLPGQGKFQNTYQKEKNQDSLRNFHSNIQYQKTMKQKLQDT